MLAVACQCLCVVTVVALAAVLLIVCFLRTRPRGPFSPKTRVVAFFHPYCDAGGGGERVLWCALLALQEKYSDIVCVVYTGDTAAPEVILGRAKERFNLDVSPARVHFVKLRKRHLIEAERYPRFTLLCQSVGSIFLGLEALCTLRPDIFIDSMGYAFTYPLAKFGCGCRVGTYTHYPTISEDMLAKVREMRPDFNNAAAVSHSVTATHAKLIYYRLFAVLYGLCGRCAEVVMVNSSWTRRHIQSLWHGQPDLVFPPCETTHLLALDLPRPLRPAGCLELISIGQFRPEKDHALQLRAMACVGRSVGAWRLHVVGSVRDDKDQARVEALRKLAVELDIEREVEFHVNATFSTMLDLLRRCVLGLHTMWNEHFGISVVEFMAAGVVPIAHNSAGPKEDIVVAGTGYLATTPEEYAKAVKDFASLPDAQAQKMRETSRKAALRFSEKQFKDAFLAALTPLVG